VYHRLANGTVAEASGGRGLGLIGRDDDNILQALDVDLFRPGPPLAGKEISEHAFGHGELVRDGALEGGAREDEHGP
jgi:hypothetical protein